MYVWFDALGNYITALGYAEADPQRGPRRPSRPLGPAAYATFWAGPGERVHVIGKGIVRFHAVYWPAMLLSAGVPLPTTVFVHGYLTVEGQRMGKSMGNAVDPQEVAARYGADALRWYLLREIPSTTDSDFAVARLVARYNTDLANDLGNLLNRTNAMLHRYRGGVVPAPPSGDDPTGLAALAAGLPERVAAAMEAYDPRRALDHVWELVVRGNRAVDETAPWALYRAESAGEPSGRGGSAAAALDAILYALLETLRLVAVHLEPFLPEASAQVLRALGVPDGSSHAGEGGSPEGGPRAGSPEGTPLHWGMLLPGTATAAPTPLFPRIEAAETPGQPVEKAAAHSS
jgi:methionyl-tRNA synthetase